jgi:hypothetical protein
VNRTRRRLPLRIAAGFFAFVFWVPSLALTDLVLGLIPDSSVSSHAAGNLAYGVIGAVLIAPALASQVRRPHRKIAPLQQVALVAVALACSGPASGEPVGVAGAALVLIPLVVLLSLHPDRRDVLRRPRRPSVPLLALALAAAVPALVYAWEVTANGRADLPPEDSFAFVPSLWSAAAGMALGTILVALLAALRPPGWPVSAGCVAVAALLFGIASSINPDIAASGGRGWGAAAIVWSVAWLAAAARERESESGLKEQRERAT